MDTIFTTLSRIKIGLIASSILAALLMIFPIKLNGCTATEIEVPSSVSILFADYSIPYFDSYSDIGSFEYDYENYYSWAVEEDGDDVEILWEVYAPSSIEEDEQSDFYASWNWGDYEDEGTGAEWTYDEVDPGLDGVITDAYFSISYPITMNVSVSSSPTPGTDVTFTASITNDPGGLTISWSGGEDPSTGSGTTFTTQWGSPGSQTVTASFTGGPCDDSGSKTVDVGIDAITHVTNDLYISDKSRLDVGVGESVTLSLPVYESGAPYWSPTAGSGSVTPSSGYAITYTAGPVGGTDTITATMNGESTSISFNVVQPTNTDVVYIPSTYTFDATSKTIGFQATPVITSIYTVSFKNVKFREDAAADSALPSPNYYASDDGYPVGAGAENFMLDATTVMGTDTIGFLGYSPGTSYASGGSVLLDVPTEYKCNGSWHSIGYILSGASIDTSGNVTVYKGSVTKP